MQTFGTHWVGVKLLSRSGMAPEAYGRTRLESPYGDPSRHSRSTEGRRGVTTEQVPVVASSVAAMIIESKRFLGGHEIKPGARIPHPTRLQEGALRLFTVCDQVNPDRWHAEITVLGKTVLATGQYDTDTHAARAAEQQLIDKLAHLLAE